MCSATCFCEKGTPPNHNRGCVRYWLHNRIIDTMIYDRIHACMHAIINRLYTALEYWTLLCKLKHDSASLIVDIHRQHIHHAQHVICIRLYLSHAQQIQSHSLSSIVQLTMVFGCYRVYAGFLATEISHKLSENGILNLFSYLLLPYINNYL